MAGDAIQESLVTRGWRRSLELTFRRQAGTMGADWLPRGLLSHPVCWGCQIQSGKVCGGGPVRATVLSSQMYRSQAHYSDAQTNRMSTPGTGLPLRDIARSGAGTNMELLPRRRTVGCLFNMIEGSRLELDSTAVSTRVSVKAFQSRSFNVRVETFMSEEGLSLNLHAGGGLMSDFAESAVQGGTCSDNGRLSALQPSGACAAAGRFLRPLSKLENEEENIAVTGQEGNQARSQH